MLSFGVRGVTGMEVTVYGPTRGLHSGHYGNWAPVPGQMLANLLASMKDDDGKVLIDGFYDTVEPLGDLEMEALRKLPRYDEELMRELGLARTEGRDRPWRNGFSFPPSRFAASPPGIPDALTQNVIPPTATAALGIRLVKGNDPEHMRELVEAHIRRQGYHIVREDPDMETRLTYPKIAKVTGEGGYPAARSPMDLPILQEVVAAAKTGRRKRRRGPIPGLRRVPAPLPVHRRSPETDPHGPHRQPRRSPARPRREPENLESVVWDRFLRPALHDAGGKTQGQTVRRTGSFQSGHPTMSPWK